MRNPWPTRLLPLTLLPACVVRLPDGDDEIGETVDESTDGSDDATSETGDATDTGNDECPSPPESPADFSYVIDIPGVDLWDTDITWTCSLLGYDTMDGLSLSLDCPDANGPVSIAVYADPLFNPEPMDGAEMTLRYVSEGPFWFNSYLDLRMNGYHLLTLVDGDSLLPPEPYVFDSFDITTVSGLCDPVPDGCGDAERLGLAIYEFLLFEGDYATHVLGEPGINVYVAEATHLHDVQCTDTPDEWFRVLITTTAWE